MSELDRLKERIAFEKQAFFLLFATGLAIIAWLFTNFPTLELKYVYFCVSALVVVGTAVAILLRSILNKIDMLRDL